MRRVRRWWEKHNHVHDWKVDSQSMRIFTCRKCYRFKIR